MSVPAVVVGAVCLRILLISQNDFLQCWDDLHSHTQGPKQAVACTARNKPSWEPLLPLWDFQLLAIAQECGPCIGRGPSPITSSVGLICSQCSGLQTQRV